MPPDLDDVQQPGLQTDHRRVVGPLYPALVVANDYDALNARLRLERYFDLVVTHLAHHEPTTDIRLGLCTVVFRICDYDGEAVLHWRRPPTEFEKAAFALAWHQVGRRAAAVTHLVLVGGSRP